MSTDGSQNAAAQPAHIAGQETKKLGYSLYIWLSEDKLECRCSYVPHEMGSMITRDELKSFMASSGVKEGFIANAMEDFAIKAAAGQSQTMVLLAKGISAVAGEDGRLSFTAQPSVIETREVDGSDKVDMRNVQTFINVMPGDEIGRIVAPTPGTPGRSVTGLNIPPRAGKPMNLKVGDNITTHEDGTLLLSDAAGRVCLSSTEVSVSEEYVVAGDVNFRVGSIVFNGFVEVRGDILDGFNVNARKGMHVTGNIGACQIESEGDISFCGMDGQEKGNVVCGGSLTANFIHESSVECAGNVTVEVEIHSCQINTLGRITVNKGAISGGSYTALRGIESRKIGSPASVKTTLRAGFDYRDAPEIDRISAELDENSTRMAAAADFKELEELRKVRGDLTVALLEIKKRSEEVAHAKVNVKAIIYDNTYIQFGMADKVKVDERDGPFSAIENTIEGGIRYLSMTSLDVMAADIERAFVKEMAFKPK